VRKINTVVGPTQRGTLAVTPLLQHAPGRLIRPVWEDTTQAHLVLNRGTPSFTQASLDLLNCPSSGDRRNSQTLTMVIATKDQDAPVTVHKISINAEEVREAVYLEHALTFREALALYPKAIGWSCYFSLGVVMLGRYNPISRVTGSVTKRNK
jgi:hypothetical protein